MTRATLAALVGGLCALLLGPSAAHAGFQPQLVDFCFGVDHPPIETENPPPGASVLLKADSLRRVPEGATVEITVRLGENGPTHSGTGTVDATGRVLVPIGINNFGNYTVTDANVTVTNPDGSTTTQPIADQVGQSFTVGSPDVPCDPESLPEGEVLEEPTDDTEPTDETDETPGSTVGPTQTRPQPTEGGGGTDFPWPGVLIGLGIPFLGGGLFIWLRKPKQCDWAAYYDTAAGRKVLRKARGKECCRYVVKVTSTLNSFDFAAKGRQAPDTLDGVDEAPEGRLRIFDAMLNPSCLDWHGWAAARSGPFGRLDWMQANRPENAPQARPPVTSDDYRGQFRQHEEDPDAAVHISLWEQSDVSIVLESMCPDHENTYVATGESKAYVESGHECSNREPGPECPVELAALSASRTTVGGDLTYSLDAPAAGDVDEVEGVGGLDVREVNGETFYGSHVDSHDHITRAHEESQQTFSGKGNNTKKADDFALSLHNHAVLDVGSIVPARVWDTTDEVSALCYVDMGHKLTIDATMKRVGCAAGACCGADGCLCAPKLQVWFRNGTAGIDCDGKKFKLNRNTYDFVNLFAPGAGPIAWDIK